MGGSQADPDSQASLRLALLRQLYGADASIVAARLEALLSERAGLAALPDLAERTGSAEDWSQIWSERDVWLIAYPDQFQRTGEAPLATLGSVADDMLGGLFAGVHVLPFYPWSSDEGFSVIDYRRVHEGYGTWADIANLAASRRLMIDAVINHVSTRSQWFLQFLDGVAPYDRFFRAEPTDLDTSAVVRPRTHELLTDFETSDGTKAVWTTFSPDQADLNYANPDVLLEIVGLLLDYVDRGASVIRLDAVGFLWKDPTRSSLNLPETHATVQVLRSCLDEAAPGTLLISETNVPHAENISYLSEDPPEAHAVYQFALAPLLADAALSGEVGTFVGWANELAGVAGAGRTFFNFLASHDGIGVRPVEGLLAKARIDRLVRACERAGGRVSSRALSDGSVAPYELNTTWFDLLAIDVDESTAIARHLATHAVMLALPGMPAIYAHSLFGTSNHQAGWEETGDNRALNRERFVDTDELQWSLDNPNTRRARVFGGLRSLVEARTANPAFHPEAMCTIDEVAPGVVRIVRSINEHRAAWTISLSGTRQVVGGQPMDPYTVWI